MKRFYDFMILLYIYIGLNLFKCIHKITNVKIILILNKTQKKKCSGTLLTNCQLLYFKILFQIIKNILQLNPSFAIINFEFFRLTIK